jgi:hypothetical protein
MNADQAPERTSAGRSDGRGPDRAYWRVGVALLGLVLLILGGATVLDRQLRPVVGIEPVVPVPSATPADPAPAIPTGSTPATAPAAPAVAAAESTPATRAEQAPLTTSVGPPPTEAVVPGPAGLGGPAGAGEEMELQAWCSTGSPLELDVEAAYLRFWQVRGEAYLALDESRMPEVAAGPQLTREQQNIRELQVRGRAGRLNVEHSSPIAFIELAPDSAVVYDEYLDRSRLVDPTTKQEVGADGLTDVEKLSFRLQRTNGAAWKVVDSARHP